MKEHHNGATAVRNTAAKSVWERGRGTAVAITVWTWFGSAQWQGESPSRGFVQGAVLACELQFSSLAVVWVSFGVWWCLFFFVLIAEPFQPVEESLPGDLVLFLYLCRISCSFGVNWHCYNNVHFPSSFSCSAVCRIPPRCHPRSPTGLWQPGVSSLAGTCPSLLAVVGGRCCLNRPKGDPRRPGAARCGVAAALARCPSAQLLLWLLPPQPAAQRLVPVGMGCRVGCGEDPSLVWYQTATCAGWKSCGACFAVKRGVQQAGWNS